MPSLSEVSHSISATDVGSSADSHIRTTLACANQVARTGDMQTAMIMLEEHVRDDTAYISSTVSVRLYMRLAALYRFFGRFVDELEVLERFNQLHPSDCQRARVDARLSKVHVRIAASSRDRIPLPITSGKRVRRTDVERRISDRKRAYKKSLANDA